MCIYIHIKYIKHITFILDKSIHCNESFESANYFAVFTIKHRFVFIVRDIKIRPALN